MAFLPGVIAGSIIGGAVGPLTSGLNQGLNTVFPIEILSPNDLIDLHHRGGLSTHTFYALMRRHGYDTESAKTFYYAKDAIVTPEQAVTLRIHDRLSLLYLIKENQLTQADQITGNLKINQNFALRAKRQGYRTSEAEDLFNANRPLPTFSTLLDWMAKEVFEPDQIEEFKLNAEQPAELKPYFSTYGVPSQESDNYWIAHWNTIGVEKWNKLYQRFRADRFTEDYRDVSLDELAEANVTWDDVKITEDAYNNYYRVLELSPYFRSRGRGSVYDPLPFTILQQLWQFGVLEYDEMLGRLRDYGYSKYSSGLILEAWQRKFPFGAKEPLRDNITWRYSKRLISRGAASLALGNAGLTSDAIDFLLNQIDDKIEESKIKIKLSTLKKVLERSTMTDAQLVAKIGSIVGASNADRIVLEMEIIKSYVANYANRIGVRYPARGFASGSITEVEFRAYLTSKYITGNDQDLAVKAYANPV